MTSDEKAIREVIETWMRATKAGDVETVLGLMTDDVVFLVAGQEPFGKDTFAKGMRGMGTQYEMDGTAEVEEVTVLGDWAYTRAHLSVVMKPVNEARPIARAGFTLSIFRKGPDGRWRIARDANMMMTDPA